MKKRRSKFSVVLVMTFVILTIGSAVLFLVAQRKKIEGIKEKEIEDGNNIEDITTEEKASSDEEVTNIPSENVDVLLAGSEVYYENTYDVFKPDKIKAGFLRPKIDFYKSEDDSLETIKKQINESFLALEELGFNTILIDLQYDDKVIYPSNNIKNTEENNILEYILEVAAQKGIYSYSLINVKNTLKDEEHKEIADNNDLNIIYDEIKQVTNSYKTGGVILSGYDVNDKKIGYQDYVTSGQGMGFNNYMKMSSDSLVKNITSELKTTNPNLEVGLFVDPVWANKTTEESGSNTKSTYEQLKDGFSNTKLYVENKYVDFVMVNNFYSLEDKDNSFNEIAVWWGNLVKANETELYILHSSDKVNKEGGFKDKEELSNQVETLKEIEKYRGSIFNSIPSLISDETGSTKALLDAMDIKKMEAPPVAKELKITNLEKLEFTTEEPNILIRGSSDPKEPLLVNGVEVARDENGYFAFNTEIDVGTNEYEFFHKDKKIIVKINKKIQIINTVSPKESISAEGGTKLVIDVIAYERANVVAMLAGQAVTLERGASGDGNGESTSNYVNYNGVITLPEGINDEQNLGEITIKASWKGINEEMGGATVKINKIITTSIKDGNFVEIINTTETFSVNDTSDYSNPNSYPLPRGAIDRLASELITYQSDGKTYSYYHLASGNRIYASSVKEFSQSKEENMVEGMTIKNDGRYTYVILNNTERISYNMSVYDGYVSVNLIDTIAVSGDMPNLKLNPMFSSASWHEMTLKLKLKGMMTGITPYYEGKKLVLRFNNPLGPVGSLVVIDPGHSTVDPGALGFYPDLNERELNVAVANKVVNKLEENGVTTRLVPTTGITSLQSRVIYGNNNRADLFVSIHHNSSAGDTATGTEAYYFNSQSENLSKYIANNISNNTGLKNRGGKFGYFYVTRHQNYPAVLVECGFVSTINEYNQLIQDYMQEEIADGIVSGILSYLNDRYISTDVGEEHVGDTTPDTNEPSDSSTLNPGDSSQSSSSQSSSSQSSSSQSSSSQSSSSQSSSSQSSSSQSSSSQSESSDDSLLYDPNKDGVLTP